MNTRRIFLVLALGLFAAAIVMPGLFGSAAEAVNSAPLVAPSTPRPSELDVRGLHGVPRGTDLRAPTAAQLRALTSLQGVSGASLQVRYNGLTATPNHLFSYTGYLTPPSSDPPEKIARDFLRQWRGIFRFSDADLSNLRLKSRATLPDTGTTILVLEQQVNNLPVYKGEVLVNVNRAGRVINVGSESFPQLSVANGFTLSASQAIVNAANALGINGFAPQSLGLTPVLRSFGDLPPYTIEGQKFSGGGTFTDNIIVTRVVFPLGNTGRAAYKFVLTTPQYEGIMWENIVDAQNGQILRRASLTAFQDKSNAQPSGTRRRSSNMKGTSAKEAAFGPPGGGAGVGRLGTFRPDIQNFVEANNSTGTATGKVFDGAPTAFSGVGGVGRPAGTAGGMPAYAPESTTARASGRGFKQSLVFARTQTPLVYSIPFGQIARGFPDAANPTAASPFGWFYLPTNTGGAQITDSDVNRATTQAFGYNMSTEAATRNVPENSPNCAPPAACADKSQPFSATLTTIPSTTLADSRVLTSVFESNYTEGNNALVADDHASDNETTHGIKGYSADRKFVASYFDFINSYEFGGVDAGGTPFFPPSTFPDVYPGAVTLFYYNNLLHDYLYSIGFTEPLWNFQQDNFGKGGAGRDAVSVQVQDGSGTDNANMGTGADGGAPRMQMFLFTDGGFRRSDGDMDFDIVAHELYHGVSNRSAGKGDTGCLGVTLVGESGGQGEGWSDYIASSMGEDDAEGEYATGEHDIGIRRLPVTNYRWSYGSINGVTLNRRDRAHNPLAIPDQRPGGIPYEVHDIGEVWSAVLWDMRELLIVKDPGGVFFDGTRRLGLGTPFYIGNRLVNSVDTLHPIDYRESFRTTAVQAVPGGPAPAPTIKASEHIVRPGLIAAENAQPFYPNRSGPLATAVSKGARLADTLVLRGLQLSPCNPSFVDSRDSILLADRELTGGENQAIIWRAFASHGVGVGARSSSGAADDPGSQNAPAIVEDFAVPQGVTQCETLGPLAAPVFTLSNTIGNTVTVTITLTPGANKFIISRAESAGGPFVTIAEVPASTNGNTTYNDAGRELGKTYYYQVRASRDAQSNCVSTSNPAQAITVTSGVVLPVPPLFFGVNEVLDPKACNLLVVNWDAAVSTNPNAQIVYDVYRTDKIDPVGNPGISEPTFTPTAANRITPAGGVTTTTYTDTGLTLDKPYYYIVQARDLNNNQLDTGNAGNRLAKFNAPTSPSSTNTPVFPNEDFETTAASTRFNPPLTESGNDPNEANVATFQRVTGIPTGSGLVSSTMYAANFTPGGEADPTYNTGGPSDFSTRIGPGTPLQLTPTSILEFDHFFSTEASFDGGVVEISIGDPTFNGNNPLPNNTTHFDLGYYMIEGGYNGRLNGTLAAGVILSPLQNRRAFTGAKGLHHVRIALQPFAGGINNPTNAPVYIRFRMTSDVGTSAGVDAGWYIDNLVINNLDPAACPSLAAVALGDVIISEFRLRGADGPNDEFIELYNRTEAPIIVTPSDNSGGFTLAAPNTSGVLTPLATIQSGTVIPARGHLLVANNSSIGGTGGYSLSAYGANGATPDITYQSDIPDNTGVALFRTTNTASLTAANRLDAAGFSSAPSEYREGAGLAPVGSTNAEYSFVRNLTSGLPKDTDDNAADFLLVNTSGAPLNGVPSILGAPGPENSSNPIQRNAVIKASLVDPNCAGFGSPTSACARVRTAQGANPQNAAYGTLLIRRRFKNTTNEGIRQLRFRAVNISTLGNLQPGEADVRLLSSSDLTVTDPNGDIFIAGLTLEENPPAQPNGGGLNSTVRLGTITMGRPLAPGNSVNVQFRLGVMSSSGNFRFLVNVEALP